ncbi:hypothetical protein CVT26_011849 [Gymnopilus dilepis]|uniref:AMP-dependent synthetase/ligase domain-containing protein n=1 Tax=Gymnopilus dilepis TaxID=231916 RepID=A0A409WJZ4_9AGAR|nr:hypothetical protein CVT26_011849 [Gymnopilus dilepis]
MPALGPTPSEFTTDKLSPSSYMGDDHTPIELSWVLHPSGKHTVRFTMEPLSKFNGSPTESNTWMEFLQGLGRQGRISDFNLEWAKICLKTLVYDGHLLKNDSQHHSQFSIGADLTHSGLVGKAYFLPHILSQATGEPPMELITRCVTEMDLGSQWHYVTAYLQSKTDMESVPEIVAVDCVKKSENRAKVYIRTAANSLNQLIELFTLGGLLCDPTVLETVTYIRKAWGLLFGDIDEDYTLESRNPGHYASRFVLYFELSLMKQYPAPKLYIPVRHYCENDSVVAKAISQLCDEGIFSARGLDYPTKIQSVFIADKNGHIISTLLTSIAGRQEFVVFRPRQGKGWGEILSSTFHHDLLQAKGYFKSELGRRKIEPGSVVASWLTGRKYLDTINILGLMFAGYIPQLFSTIFDNTSVVWDLMLKSGASCLIYDEEFADRAALCTLPTLRAYVQDSGPTDEEPRHGSIPHPSALETDTAFIIHSSGTTSGMPKLIPVSHGWLNNFVTIKYPGTLKQGNYDDRNITNTLGSLAHVGSITAFMGAVYSGFCTVQSSSMAAPTAELIDMISIGGVNRLVLYASYLSTHIKVAKHHNHVAQALASCRQILHTGVALPKDDEEWAIQNNLKITTMYGTSETAPLMTSIVGKNPSDRLLRFIPGVTCAALIPCSVSSNALDAPIGREVLFEMVCYPGKQDSPHDTLFTADDVLFHTEDLFEEVTAGLYKFRGRKGDWVKTLNGFCDAKAMEDKIRETCSDIIHDVAVVGDNWPQPCVFIEALPSEREASQLVPLVIERNKTFSERLFFFERIQDPQRIIVVPYGSLPRTKVVSTNFILLIRAHVCIIRKREMCGKAYLIS